MTIELYGRLKDAGFGDVVELEARDGATAAELLAELKARFGAQSPLLDGTVLATETAVLAPGDVAHGKLAALPPVCGG